MSTTEAEHRLAIRALADDFESAEKARVLLDLTLRDPGTASHVREAVAPDPHAGERAHKAHDRHNLHSMRAMPALFDELSARMGRWGWNAWYRFFSWYVQRTPAQFSCMNWGYRGPDVPVLEGPERYCLQLYEHVVAGMPLRDARMVEIGSGRGGGLAHLCVTHAPQSALGIDFVPRHTQLSNRSFQHLAPRLRFDTADAEATRLDDASADVLISVESSHCYPSQPRFLREARRVLHPGGLLGWVDFRPIAAVQQVQHDALETGFEIVAQQDITSDVLAAMREDAQRRVDLVHRYTHPILHRTLLNFAAAASDCDTVRRLADGSYAYFSLRLRRAV